MRPGKSIHRHPYISNMLCIHTPTKSNNIKKEEKILHVLNNSIVTNTHQESEITTNINQTHNKKKLYRKKHPIKLHSPQP
jgi:hypothetical protein